MAVFTGIELAGRVERAEVELIAASVRAATARRPEVDGRAIALAGGVAALCEPGSPLNKVAGLGFAGPVAEEELARVERAFHDRGLHVQVELSTLADPSVAPLLSSRGYALVGFENVLGRSLPADVPDVPGIAVARCGPADLDTWVDVVVTGFAAPDVEGVPSAESFPREALERAIGDMAAVEGFARYFALRDGAPVAAGSLRTSGGVAHLCGATTLPAHRRRGAQTALLAARLADAARAGCDLAVMTTQPGSKSAENGARRGFELLYPRAVLVLEP